MPEASALIITEFMPNPEGSDEDLEWIELYNQENYSVNIDNYYLNGKQLPQHSINPKETIVLVRQLLDKDNDNLSFEKQYGNKDNIWNENFTAIEFSFSLTNQNGTINLTDLSITDIIFYETTREGFSFIKESNNFTISTVKYGGPGIFLAIKNNISEITINESLKQDQEISLEIIEFMPNPKGPDNSLPPNGEWVKIRNNGDPISLEGYYLEDSSKGKLYFTNSNIHGSLRLSQNEQLIIYRNGLDSFSLNNNGDTLNLKFNNSLFDSVSYTPTIEGVAWKKINGTWKLTEETKEVEKNTENFVRIEKIYGKAQFDNTIFVKLNIYFVDSSDNSLTIFIDNITDKMKMQLYSKNINYSLLLPLKIKSNCNNEFNEGNYFVTATGLSTFDKKRIFVESAEDCGLTQSIPLKQLTSPIITETITQQPLKEALMQAKKENIINTNKVFYTSKESKIQSYALILFVALLILIAGALVYGRWENTYKDNIGSGWGSKRARRENHKYDFGEYKEE